MNKRGLTAAEVYKILDDFIEGRGDAWSWDDFICADRIEDESLRIIRAEAGQVDLPVDEKGMQQLRDLRLRAQELAEESRS